MQDDAFEQIFEGHPEPWCVVELDGERIVLARCNAAQGRKFGRAPADLARADLRRFLSAPHHAEWLCMLRKALESGVAQRFQLGPGANALGGSPMAGLVLPLTPAASGHPRFAVTVREQGAEREPFAAACVPEATGPQDAPEFTGRRDEALEVLFEENVNGVYISLLDEPIDWDGATDKDALADWALEHARPVRVNRALAAIMGPTDDLIGRPLSDFFPDRLMARRQFRALYDSGRLHLARTMRLRSDGTRRFVDLDLVVMRDRKGRITGQFGMLRDVTEREVGAEALRNSEARLALALESAEQYVWGIDLRTNRLETDPRWAARLGYQEEELNDAEFARGLVLAADRAAMDEAFENLVAGKSASVALTYRHSTGGGTFRWVEIFGKVTERGPDGAPWKVTGICRDVTERRELEQRLLAAERMASLGTLAAGIGHEINNPLTYLSASLALLDETLSAPARAPSGGDANAELRRMVSDARDGVARIVRIVRDLRSLSRGDALLRRKLDLKAVIERSLELAENQIRHRATLQRELGEGLEVVADEGRLIQLFLNLLVNAAQAIDEGAAESNSIRVVTKRVAPEEVMVEIVDSGRGMEAEVLTRVFDPFFTTKTVREGLGLGLPICHSIVRELGGSIEAESCPGKGSVFRVRLPAAQETVAPPPPPKASEPASANQLRILIIDDEATVGRLLARILRGHEVVVETRAADALTRLKGGESFDRILCDVMMPETSGVDFYESLKEHRPELLPCILFMTGGAFSSRAATFLANVPNPTLEKPFEPAALRAAVEKPLA